MSLKKYQKKRTFSKTPEPRKSHRIRKSLSQRNSKRFVIQEHNARNLHYDFRLEIGGVLKSWAVPKKPPEKEGIKRLAMQTEDHPIEYLDFEGVIPAGQYGAGTVKIWDKGKFKLEEKSAETPEEGPSTGLPSAILGTGGASNLIFKLKGDKLKGRYALINIDSKKWLFFKTKED